MVVKTISGTQGAGVCLLRDRGSFEDFLQFVHASGGQVPLILQEFVASSRGRDLRASVVGNEVLGCMCRHGGDFKANISAGGTGTPQSLDGEIEHLALETTRLKGLEIAGVDLLFNGNGYVVCEANSSPGFSAWLAQSHEAYSTALIASYCFDSNRSVFTPAPDVFVIVSRRT